MHAFGGVVLQVMQVDQRRLAQVVVREVKVADLGAQHGLRRCRQRRVAHGPPLVVVDVARLLLLAERSGHQCIASTRSACLTTCRRYGRA